MLLVAQSADVGATTKFGATALELAARHKEREWEAVVRVLASVDEDGFRLPQQATVE